MKKLILLLLIAVLSTSAYAQYATITEEGNYYRVSIPVNKGWNLLPADSFSLWEPLPESQAMFMNMKAMFMYLPIQNKYLNALGGLNEADNADAMQNQDFLLTSAIWYYFDAKGDIFFRFPKNLPSTSFKLEQGWNLFAVPPQFDSDSGFGNLGFGNCDVLKAFMFDTENNKWFEFTSPDMPLKDKIVSEGEDFAGLSFAIKVASNCELGPVEDITIPSVPQLPG